MPPHQSVIWLAHCHHISQSFDLPTATTSVSHLTCSLPLCHRITALLHQSVTWLPPPPHQSVIWLAHYHHISQSFDLPTATTSVSHLSCPLPLHHCITTSLHYCVTALVSHLTFPLQPHQSVIWHSLYHHINFQTFSIISSSLVLLLVLALVIWLVPTTTSVSHLTCPLFFVVIECPHHLTCHHHWSCIHFWAK